MLLEYKVLGEEWQEVTLEKQAGQGFYAAFCFANVEEKKEGGNDIGLCSKKSTWWPYEDGYEGEDRKQ